MKEPRILGISAIFAFGILIANTACAQDTDMDGIPDTWELQYGLNPNDPADANADSDSDHLKNLFEYQISTNPRGNIYWFQHLVDLHTPGFPTVRIVGATSSGHFATSVFDGDVGYKGYWWNGSVLSQLTTPGNGAWARLTAMNASGHIVGDDGGNAIIWRSGVPEALPSGFYANDINDAGKVLATWTEQDPEGGYFDRAVLWDSTIGGTGVEIFTAEVSRSFYAVNNLDQVLGTGTTDGLYFLPFIWSPSGGGGSLGTIDGVVTLNDSGAILCASSSGGLAGISIRKGPNTIVVATFPNGDWFSAADIDSTDRVIGGGSISGVGRGFLWKNGTLTDLDSAAANKPAGTIIRRAAAFSGPDVIVEAEYSDGHIHAARILVPQNSDSDGDGLSNDWETYYGLNPNSASDGQTDPDGDGASNLVEYGAGTNPNEEDTDFDGMWDGWEIQYGLDPLTNGASNNSDGDLLTDFEEFQLQTLYGILFDPTKTFTASGVRDGEGDADGDGVNDSDELHGGSSPNDDNSYPSGHPSLDLDRDDLPDAYEINQFGNTTSQSGEDDPDGDGITNRQERILNTIPTVDMTNGIRKDGLSDQDGDNVLDIWELEDGTNPNSAASVDFTTNFVVLVGRLEHLSTWGPSILSQFNGTIMRAKAIGFEDAERVSSSNAFGIWNDVHSFVSTGPANAFHAERTLRFRKGVAYSVEITSTSVNLPFISGKYRFSNSPANADEPDEKFFAYEVLNRQPYSADLNGIATATDPSITPNPDINNTHFTFRTQAGGPDATLYSTGTLALGKHLSVDRNMNGILGTGDPKDLQLPDYPRGLIVDVNNTLSGGSLLNADSVLTEVEKNNSTPGYANSRRVEPLRINWGYGGLKVSTTAVLKLEAGAENQVRVFDNGNPPVAVLGPGVPSYTLSNAQKQTSGGLNFWIEGLKAGEVFITLELTASGGNVAYHKERLRVEVNVDRPPTTVSNTPHFGARHRARAIKQASQIRSISADIYSRRPLLTWTPQAVRTGMTASLWIGFEPTYYNKKAWAQVGLQSQIEENKKIHTNPTEDKSKSFVYCEVAADYDAYEATIDTRYFKNRFYPASPTLGQHRWQNISASIDYIADPTVTTNDTIRIVMKPADNQYNPMTLLEFAGDHEPNAPDVDLSVIPFDEYQAGWESTASITRLPGTKLAPATIPYITIRTGPRLSIGSPQQADFTDANLEIKLVDPNSQAGAETLHQTKDPITGATSHLHYNIRLASPYSIELWDSYTWPNPDPQRW